MSITPIENLKDFAHNRPPVMVFMACLGFFAIILMSLAYYVKLTEDIPDPDIRQDWNQFLKHFAKLEFCIQYNTSDIVTPAHMTTTVGSNQPTTQPIHSIRERDLTTTDVYDRTRNYSISMQLTVTPTLDFIRIPHNVTHVSGTITGDMIGLHGTAGKEEINVTMELPYEWNNTKCGLMGCEKISFFACVHFQASTDVFPSISPKSCESINDTGIEYYTTMLPQKTTDVYWATFCRQRPVIHIQPTIDPALTVYLSLMDRSVINLHLMHTSYFLFVMVVTILCYALIRGRPLKSKITQTEGILIQEA